MLRAMGATITGQGQLKIDGEPMAISFTVPVDPCLPEGLLPDVQRFADQVTGLAERRARAGGRSISCAKGCGACCRQMVPISSPEARHVAGLVQALPTGQRETVRARFAAAREKMAAAGVAPQGHPDGDKAAYRDYGLAYFRQGVPCPFLEEESCSIHAVRPLVCREYLVTSPPAACAVLGSGQVRQVPVPLRVWAAYGRSASADGSLTWMPLIDALDYAAKNPAPVPDRTGPQHVEALFKAVQTGKSGGPD